MQNIKDQLKSVIKLFNNGEKQKAFEKVNLLITKNDKDINFLLLHSKICIDLNEIDKASSSLEKILSLDFNNYEALKLIYVNYLKKIKLI